MLEWTDMLEWAVSSGVLVMLVLLVRRLFKGRIRLGLQYGLWLLVLVRLLVPANLFATDVSVLNLLSAQPVRDMPSAGQDAGAAVPQQGTAPGFLTGTVSRQDGAQRDNLQEELRTSAQEGEKLVYHGVEGVRGNVRLPELLRGIWAVGMLIAAAVLGGINLHFYRRLRRARKPLEDRSGIEGVPRGRKRPAVYVVQGLSGPCLFGLMHPAIYLPEGITEEQMPYVLAHEESHYRVGDHIWSLLRSLCLALHWYHPMVWLAAYVSRQDSELACDERTIRYLGEERRRIYGRILVDMTVEKMSAADFLCCATTMTADGRSLKERVGLIAHKPRMLAATGGLVAALLVAVSCVACTGAKDSAVVEPDAEENTGPEESGNGEEATDGTPEDTENRLPEAPDGSSEEDFSYYREVTGAVIDDPWFTMEVPESLAGEIAYGVVLKENEAGEKYLQNLTFFHIDSMEAETTLENAPQYSWREVYWLGALCSYDWTGYPDLEADLEEIVYRSGAWDIRGMEFLLARDYDQYAGVSGILVQANEAGTGAYFYMEPTDVQYDPGNPDGYMACAEALAACRDHFAAKSFPYEELEGYSGDASAEMPRWRQDFEEAERIYAWFTTAEQAPVKSMRNDGGDYGSYTTPEGLVYTEADVPGVSSMEDFRRYLGRWFEPELVEDLLSGRKPSLEKSPGSFTEVDSKLYALVAWISELAGAPQERQYAACFTELTDAGQERPIRMYAENGGRRRVQIYTDCRYNVCAPEPIRAVLCYTMEEQDDGSWRIVGDYELATLRMLYAPQE